MLFANLIWGDGGKRKAGGWVKPGQASACGMEKKAWPAAMSVQRMTMALHVQEWRTLELMVTWGSLVIIIAIIYYYCYYLNI